MAETQSHWLIGLPHFMCQTKQRAISKHKSHLFDWARKLGGKVWVFVCLKTKVAVSNLYIVYDYCVYDSLPVCLPAYMKVSAGTRDQQHQFLLPPPEGGRVVETIYYLFCAVLVFLFINLYYSIRHISASDISSCDCYQ